MVAVLRYTGTQRKCWTSWEMDVCLLWCDFYGAESLIQIKNFKCLLPQRQNSLWDCFRIGSKATGEQRIRILICKWSASVLLPALFSRVLKHSLLHSHWHEIYSCNKVGFFSLSFAEGSQSSVSASNEIQQNQPQALHYALANAQQVQIHQIGEDGQVQVVCTQLFLNHSI